MKKFLIASVMMMFMVATVAPVTALAQEPAKKECTKEQKACCKKDSTACNKADKKDCKKANEKTCCKKQAAQK